MIQGKQRSQENSEYLYFEGTAFAGDLRNLPNGLVDLDWSFTVISEFVPQASSLIWVFIDDNAYNALIPTEITPLLNLEFFYVSDVFSDGNLSYTQGILNCEALD